MTTLDPRLFARIMALPQGERSDLLEFLGATPVPPGQIERLIMQVTAEMKRQSNRRVPETVS